VRAAAAIALGELKSPKSIDLLSYRVLKETDPWTKIQIIQALAKILKASKDYRALPPLIELLRDENREVRNRTAVALMEITGLKFGEDPVKWEDWYEKEVQGR
jgi:HEAT repeat protein